MRARNELRFGLLFIFLSVERIESCLHFDDEQPESQEEARRGRQRTKKDFEGQIDDSSLDDDFVVACFSTTTIQVLKTALRP